MLEYREAMVWKHRTLGKPGVTLVLTLCGTAKAVAIHCQEISIHVPPMLRPNAKAGATLEGRIEWVECKSPGGLGDVIAMERPDGSTYCWGDSSPRERADLVRRRERGSQEIQRLRVQIENERHTEAQRQQAEKKRQQAPRASAPCSSKLSPACHRRNVLGSEILSDIQSSLHDATSATYCAYLIGIHVNYFCAGKYDEIGRSDCADLSEQQAELYSDALPQLRAAMDLATENRIHRMCSLGP